MRPRLGLRREVLILLPAALLLLAVLSTATMTAYRGSIARLVEERQNEAARLAGEVADRLAHARVEPNGMPLRELAPTARSVVVMDAAGGVMAYSGELPPALPLAPLEGRRLERPLGVGPDGPNGTGGAALPGVVAGFASWQSPAGRRFVRVDLDAGVLAVQSRSVRLLGLFVFAIDGALIVLVLLFLRHLLAPYELLLARARQIDPAAGAGAGGDEVELLVSTFERAVAALVQEPTAEDDFAALERTLAHSLQSGLLLLDRSGGVLALNPVGARLLGIPPPAAGAPLAEVLAGQAELRELLVQAVESGRAPQRQECTVPVEGRLLTLGLTVHPLRRDDGGVRGHIVLFADLTEARRRAEETRVADHLARLAEMSGGIAHELRNSLATLRGYLTLIERDPGEESIADYLSEIRQEADHLQRVLEDFLSFARPGSLRMEDVSLTRLAQRTAGDPALAGFAVEVHGDDVHLRGDAQLLERALRNLVHNAVEAERDAGRTGPVDIRLERRPQSAELAVEDRGPGLPPEIRERLFHPFATARRGGVGLGLALAHRIVVLHGGTIQMEDRDGGGTRARLSFPS